MTSRDVVVGILLSYAFCHSSRLSIAVSSQAERKIPMNYASRYRNSALSQQSYLPFKVASQLTLSHSLLVFLQANAVEGSSPSPCTLLNAMNKRLHDV